MPKKSKKEPAEMLEPFPWYLKDDQSKSTVTESPIQEPTVRGWLITDDICELQELIDRLYVNWTLPEDKALMRQFFRQKANEV